MEYKNYSTPPSGDLFTEEVLVYGTFWQRVGATIIDGLVLLIPNVILINVVDNNYANVISLIMYWLYDALQESGPDQATIGKKAMGLKVMGTDKGLVSFGQATGRFFGKYLSGVLLGIGFLMMLWDDRKQTLHDKLAGTLVVQS